MRTISELNQELVDYLGSMDKEEMSIAELSTYVDVLKKANDLFKPNYMDMLMNGFSPFSGCCTERKGGK